MDVAIEPTRTGLRRAQMQESAPAGDPPCSKEPGIQSARIQKRCGDPSGSSLSRSLQGMYLQRF